MSGLARSAASGGTPALKFVLEARVMTPQERMKSTFGVEQDKITGQWWVVWEGKRVAKADNETCAKAKLQELEGTGHSCG